MNGKGNKSTRKSLGVMQGENRQRDTAGERKNQMKTMMVEYFRKINNH